MAVAIRVLLFLLLLSASAEATASAVAGPAGPAVSAWEKWMDRLITCAVTCLVLAAWRGLGAKEPKELGLWEGAREGTRV